MKNKILFDSAFYRNVNRLCTDVPYAYDILKKMEAYYDYFNANLSGEMKNILEMMHKSIRYIQSAHPEVRNYRYWSELCDEAGFLMRLVRDIEDYSTCAELNLERTDLQRLLKSACMSCQTLVEGTGKSLSFTSSINSIFIMLDAVRMTEAVINIIVNAIEAVDKDGCVQVSLSRAKEDIMVQVSDNGCGIEPERIISIFQPFMTTKPGGTGLGLPAAKRIIEGHGGYIKLASAPGKGTTFTFILNADVPSAISGSQSSA